MPEQDPSLLRSVELFQGLPSADPETMLAAAGTLSLLSSAERGGQVRREIERLSENADGTLAQIRIGPDLLPVSLSPTRTKFFGVLPRDVNRSIIERELREAGFNFEIVGVNISQRDLRTIASEMVPLATTMAGRP